MGPTAPLGGSRPLVARPNNSNYLRPKVRWASSVWLHPLVADPHFHPYVINALQVGPSGLCGPTGQRDLLPGGLAPVQQTVPRWTAGRGPDQPEPSDHRVLPNQWLRFQDVPPSLQNGVRMGAALWKRVDQIRRSEAKVRSNSHACARSANLRETGEVKVK